jgi:hypothetical protein
MQDGERGVNQVIHEPHTANQRRKKQAFHPCEVLIGKWENFTQHTKGKLND